MVATHVLFLIIVALWFAERMAEVVITRRRIARLVARGGHVHAAGATGTALAVIHLTWFVAIVYEVFAYDRPFVPVIAIPCLLLSVAGMFLRYLSYRALGDRWVIQVVTVPGEPLVKRGIYRYLRHPSYLGVVLEMPAVPLIHGALVSATVYGVLNLIWIMSKIRLEDRVLAESQIPLPADERVPMEASSQV